MPLLDDQLQPTESFQKDAADHILLQGRLASTNAVFSFHLRPGAAFPGTPQFVFRVYGEDGEIEMAVAKGHVSIGGDDQTVRVWDSRTNEVQVVDVEMDGDDDALAGLPEVAQNIGRLYDAFYEQKGEGTYPDFAHAVKRHELLDQMDMYRVDA
jgi:hypothetical protein